MLVCGEYLGQVLHRVLSERLLAMDKPMVLLRSRIWHDHVLVDLVGVKAAVHSVHVHHGARWKRLRVVLHVRWHELALWEHTLICFF